MPGSQKCQGEDPVERTTECLRQIDRFDQLRETPLEVAQYEVAPPGEHVGRHALVRTEPIAEHLMALRLVDRESPRGQLERFCCPPLVATGQA